MRWQSVAPIDNETEWEWSQKAHKWIRTNDLSRLTYQFMMKQQKNQGNAKALEQNAEQYQNKIHKIRIQNQEANAWIHINYNDPHYYDYDINNKPTYNKYLDSKSDDQLRNGLKFWLGQQKNDAFRVHDDINFNQHDKANYNFAYSFMPNLINDVPDSVNDNAYKYTMSYASEWNNDLINQEKYKALLRGQTNHGADYQPLLGKYNQAINNTHNTEHSWKYYTKSIGAKTAGKDLNYLIKRDKRQITDKYYQNQSDLYHDNIRVQQWRGYMQQRHQQGINNSIREQVANNTKNNLMSIFRKDKKDDTVVGVAEMQPQESNDMNMATQPVDEGMPQTNYAQTNQWQLTDQVEVYNRPLVFNPGKIDNAKEVSKYHQYNILRNWENNSVPLIMQGGFALWHMCLIQSLSKQPDATATDNGLTFQLTIQHVRLAKIVWGKQKAKGGISKGRNKRKSGKGKYTVRPGDNMWDIAKKQHCGWHALMKANPQIKNKDLIYPKQKLVIPK